MLKLSGEVMAGANGHGFDFDMLDTICKSIKTCAEMNVEIGIVVGGGNFWRGRTRGKMERTRADNVGMLATVMNAIVLADSLDQAGVVARVMTAVEMPKIAEYYIAEKALRHFESKRVLIFGCGTGNPFFSTDSAAALRAAELGSEILLKGTNVDGVYDKDPNKYSDAVKFDIITHEEILNRGLGVMDSTATALCKDNNISTLVFNLNYPENIVSAVCGENIGTIVTK